CNVSRRNSWCVRLLVVVCLTRMMVQQSMDPPAVIPVGAAGADLSGSGVATVAALSSAAAAHSDMPGGTRALVAVDGTVAEPDLLQPSSRKAVASTSALARHAGVARYERPVSARFVRMAAAAAAAAGAASPPPRPPSSSLVAPRGAPSPIVGDTTK